MFIVQIPSKSVVSSIITLIMACFCLCKICDFKRRSKDLEKKFQAEISLPHHVYITL